MKYKETEEQLKQIFNLDNILKNKLSEDYHIYDFRFFMNKKGRQHHIILFDSNQKAVSIYIDENGTLDIIDIPYKCNIQI